MVILSRVIDSTLVVVELASTTFRWLRLVCEMTYRNKLIGQYYRDLLRVLTKRPYS